MEIEFGKQDKHKHPLMPLIIPFLRSKSRCFPHVTKISTKTGLKHLTQIPADNDPEIEDPALIEEDFPEAIPWDVNSYYCDALERDMVSVARKLVTAVFRVIRNREKQNRHDCVIFVEHMTGPQNRLSTARRGHNENLSLRPFHECPP